MAARKPKICELCGARYDTDRSTCPLDGAQLRDAPDPLIGRTIGGRYVIEEQIGAGGMGVVYKARGLTDDALVAIKFLEHSLSRSRQNRERFLREARAASRIDHEHIIHIMNLGETEDGLIYHVMEFLDGVPLNVEIRRGALAVPRALDIALQISLAIARAHELGVVHRDIKPENVFLLAGVGGDFVKVLDFGLAQMKGELKLTLTGAVFGTPEYMAPEQCRGETATAAVDLYALGAVVFEMITGTIPYGGSIAAMLDQHVRAPVPVPSSRKPGVSREVDAFVMRLLAKRREDRFQDAHHVVEEIKRLLGRAAERERKPTRVQGSDSGASRTVDIDGAWSKRIHEFREWAQIAHPSAAPPASLESQIAELVNLAGALGEVRRELQGANAQMDDREREERELRLRIGRALDELGRDESRLRREIDESRGRLDAARSRLDTAEAPLRELWGRVPALPATMPTPTTVESLRELGHVASLWLEAQRAVAELAREAETRTRELDDIVYQIGELRGRIDAIDNDGAEQRNTLSTRSQELAARRRTLLDALTDKSEQVYRYFMSVPGFRERITGARPAAG